MSGEYICFAPSFRSCRYASEGFWEALTCLASTLELVDCSLVWKLRRHCPDRRLPYGSTSAWRHIWFPGSYQLHLSLTLYSLLKFVNWTSVFYAIFPSSKANTYGNLLFHDECALALESSKDEITVLRLWYRHRWEYQSDFRNLNQFIDFILRSWVACFLTVKVWLYSECFFFCVTLLWWLHAHYPPCMFWRWKLVWWGLLDLPPLIMTLLQILMNCFSGVFFIAWPFLFVKRFWALPFQAMRAQLLIMELFWEQNEVLRFWLVLL